MGANKTWKNASSSGENKSLENVGVCFLQSGRIFCIMLTTFLHIGVHNTSRPLETKNYKYVDPLMYIYIVYIADDILYSVKSLVYLQLHVYAYECGNEIHVCIQNKTHQQNISQESVRQGFNRVLIGFAPISISPTLAPASARPKIWSKKWVTVRLGPFSWFFFHL